MKNYILACIATAVVMTSCEKDRTCTCTISKNGTATTTAVITASLTSTLIPIPLPGISIDTTFSSPVSESQTVDRKIEKVSKRTAGANCVSYTEPYQETSYNIVPNFTLTTTNTGEKTYKCELK